MQDAQCDTMNFAIINQSIFPLLLKRHSDFDEKPNWNKALSSSVTCHIFCALLVLNWVFI